MDAGVIAAIVSALRPMPGEKIVEIGPGLGALTRPLLAAARELHAIEIDRDLARLLENEFTPGLVLHTADVLAFDFAQLGTDLRVIGNLPYHISTPVLFHLAAFGARIRDIHVLLQKEVVARMAAAPSDTDYGRLSVMLQYRFTVEPLFDVPAAAFNPQPKVDSTVARLTPLRPLPHPTQDEAVFERVVAAAFMQRRKMLRNSLAAFCSEAEFASLGLAPTVRAQDLSVAQYVALANHVAQRDG